MPDGSILEWDTKKGEVEVYDKTGQVHKGGFDPKTGKQRSPAQPNRRTNKIEGTDNISTPIIIIKVLDRIVSRIIRLPQQIISTPDMWQPAKVIL
ncbi:colicin E3/pyocin S6 family cytotoxin [Paraflavitalea speifideaquila]|uniref:colicin E3/pyocin S6 family cytotoxin n=1 Tax=Paraflavitalea speifideaquila TaxID=3076558 RepID=UPI003312FF93